MNLPGNGREYAHWPYKASVAITSVDVQIDGVWHAGNVTDTEVLLLVAGPLADSNPSGTVVLQPGSHPTYLRFNDSPELIVRSGGTITVT